MYEHYKPSHSDFLIHWTGKDIDREYDPGWTNESSSITNKDTTQQYLRRLKGILKFGLWMTVDKESAFLHIGNKKVRRPCPARTCFTELKLSAVRSHAADYGRLGIGFKRPFVLGRMGGPMIYYQQKCPENWLFPPYVGQNGQYKPDDFFACFLKPMVKKSSDVTMVYRYYDESEWRIIYCQEIEDRLRKLNRTNVIGKIKKPTDIEVEDSADYVNPNCDVKPEYLIPIDDRWLSSRKWLQPASFLSSGHPYYWPKNADLLTTDSMN